MIKYKTKKCIICGREFLTRTGSSSRLVKVIRNHHCVTCSHQCSIVYSRVLRKIMNNLIKSKKKKK
jgi:hypothetical protein